MKSEEDQEIGVLFLDCRLKIQRILFPKQCSSGVISKGQKALTYFMWSFNDC